MYMLMYLLLGYLSKLISYGLGDRGSISSKGRDFFKATSSITALGPI